MRLGEREIRSILDRAEPSTVLLDREAFTVHASRRRRRWWIAVSCGPAATVWASATAGRGATRGEPAVIIWTAGQPAYRGAPGSTIAICMPRWRVRGDEHPYDVKFVGTPFPHAGYMAKVWDQLAWGSTMSSSCAVARRTCCGCSSTSRSPLVEVCPPSGRSCLRTGSGGRRLLAGATRSCRDRAGTSRTDQAGDRRSYRCPLVVRYAHGRSSRASPAPSRTMSGGAGRDRGAPPAQAWRS